MKKVTFGIIVLVLVIGGVMGSLVTRGISLRVATLIKPSELYSSQQVAVALASRLFPELQSKKWLIYSIKENSGTNHSSTAREILVELLKETKKSPVGEYLVRVAEEECEGHCLFLDETSQTGKLYNEFFAKRLEEEKSDVFRLSVSQFSPNEPFPKECESMQRLDEKCIRAISIRDSLRKMKDPSKKYFFLKKYNHNQYYLFLQQQS
jgi:hypothetical protein